MAATPAAILENTAYHARLLAQISELDYLPPALAQQESYIAGLERQAAQLAAKIGSLEMQTQKERAEHEALRDSTARKFAAAITGRKERYAAEASKEEREYVEALEKEMQHKRQHEALGAMLKDAKAVRADLKTKLEQHTKAKEELTALYSKIFDGPTQAFPEDDRLESQLQHAQGWYNDIQGHLNRESQAVGLLQDAHAALQRCYTQMQEAIDDSHWDMFGGFGPVDDIMERQELRAAQEEATKAQMFVQQAMAVSPQVQFVGQINIAQGSLVSDVLFDNVFTDMAFHQKIRASQQNVQDVQNNLNHQLALARARAAAIGADLSGAADALARARGALDEFRRGVFESLGRAGTGNGPNGGQGAPSISNGGQDAPSISCAPPLGREQSSGYTPPDSRNSPPAYPATQQPQASPIGYAPPPPQAPVSTSNSYAPPPGAPPEGVDSRNPPPPYPAAQQPQPPPTSYAPPPPQAPVLTSGYAPPPGAPPEGVDSRDPPPAYPSARPDAPKPTNSYGPPAGPPPPPTTQRPQLAGASSYAPPSGPPPHPTSERPQPSSTPLISPQPMSGSYAPPSGPPPPPTIQWPQPISTPLHAPQSSSGYAPPSRPPPPQQSTSSYAPPLAPPPTESRLASAYTPPPGPPPHPTTQRPLPVSMPLHAPQPTSMGYAPPSGPPPLHRSTSSYAPPPGAPPEGVDNRPPPPAYPTTQRPQPQPTSSYAPPSGPPPPQVPALTGNYAPPPLAPPPTGSRAASPSGWNPPPGPPLGPPPTASATLSSGPRPTNSTSPRPPANSTSPRPPTNGTGPRPSAFPPPRAPHSSGYAPPPQPQLQPQDPETETSSTLEPPRAEPRAASPSAWASRNPYAAALATGGRP